jgi:ATP-dependent protease ClpP protease subunit
MDLAEIGQLGRSGHFVIRSTGGNLVTAMRISDMLLEKNATVTIYDYCLSACANAIFVASAKTHVAAGAIVAWHRGMPRLLCGGTPPTLPADATEELKRQAESYDEYCRNFELIHGFYKRRTIDDGFTQ